jgi:checkpoint serine/threonine-protein kinase
VCDIKTFSRPCIEVQKGRSFTTQQDLYSLCDVIHTMLHGAQMQPEKQQSSSGAWVWMPSKNVHARFQRKLWEGLFRSLMNAKEDNSVLSLQKERARFEDYLSKSASDSENRTLSYKLATQRQQLSEYMRRK